jgi:spore coat polysaccharide biosynthesis protein SpsF
MILGILQARVSSSRLPGKVLLPILGAPMLERQLERLDHCKRLDRLIVATSDHESDDPIERLCRNRGIYCYRGSLDDVLDRFYQAAQTFKPQHIVRLTGDCPLADPALIDEVIERHLNGLFDYTSNCLEPTYPDGLDVEVVRYECLERAWKESSLPSQREHVTPFIHGQPSRFAICSVKSDRDMSTLRWTVDEPADFELVTSIYENLYPAFGLFTTVQIVEFLKNRSEMNDWNTQHKRNEGYQKSLAKD